MEMTIIPTGGSLLLPALVSGHDLGSTYGFEHQVLKFITSLSFAYLVIE